MCEGVEEARLLILSVRVRVRVCVLSKAAIADIDERKGTHVIEARRTLEVCACSRTHCSVHTVGE